MQAPTLRAVLVAAAFFFSIQTVGARRGGGSSGGSDSGGDSGDDNDSGSGSSGGGSSTPCVNSGIPLLTNLDITRFDNYTSDPAFGGAYFLGEASVNYTVQKEDDDDCTPVVGAKFPNRLLAAAFIAPQSPWPQGASNPIVLGFKGWPTDAAVEDIMTSYDRCDASPDMVFFRTTSWFSYTYPNNELRGVRDSVPLALSASGDSSKVDFTGTYVGGPQNRWNNISLAQWTQDRFSPPEGLCRGYTILDESIPVGTAVNGSISAGEVTLTAKGVMEGAIFGVNVSFVVDFRGTFAPANSTQAVRVSQGGDSIVSFEVINGKENGNGQGRLTALGPTAMIALLVAAVLTPGYV